MERFGEKLRFLRIHSGLTVRELSQEIGISNGYITQIETGRNKPSLEIAFKIARFFNISVDDLADDRVDLEV